MKVSCLFAWLASAQRGLPATPFLAAAAFLAFALPLNAQTFRFFEDGGVLSVETESGEVGAFWQVFSDGGSSGGAGLEIDPAYNRAGSMVTEDRPEAIATYPFEIGTGGNYTLWVRLQSQGGGDDSFFWRIGADSAWQVSNGQSGIGRWLNFPVGQINVGNGEIQLTYRENGTRLDKLVLQLSSLPSPETVNAGNGPDESPTLAPLPGTYAEWVLDRNFDDPLANNRPDANPLRRDLPNLVAYATALNTPTQRVTPVFWLDPILPGDTMVTGYFRRATGGAADVTYELVVNSDLRDQGAWETLDLNDPQISLGIHEPDADGDGAAEIMRFEIPTDDAERLFVAFNVRSDVVRLPDEPVNPTLDGLSETAMAVVFDDEAETEIYFELRYRSGPEEPWTTVQIAGNEGLGRIETALFGLQYQANYDVEIRAVHAVYGAGDWVPAGSLLTEAQPAEPFTPEQAAARFLTQATMGPTFEQITALADRIRAIGEQAALEEWTDQQLNGRFDPFVDRYMDLWNYSQPSDGSIAEINIALFTHLAETDQDRGTTMDLRKRINYALSQILVVAALRTANEFAARGIHDYYDTLGRYAFANYWDVLFNVTVHPRMGEYLSHLKNQKANPELGTNPDENYAREVMQLFSIGLYELNPDGTRQQELDGEGNLVDIPTYTNEEITAFARVFTGLAFDPNDDGTSVYRRDRGGFLFAGQEGFRRMYMYDAFHDFGEKRLLNGTVLPAHENTPEVFEEGMADVRAAIDNLVAHPNVGPFIGRLLIQQLIKSNPSPAYLSRVSAAFDSGTYVGVNGTTYGSGKRGDMKPFLMAILLDPEARNYQQLDDPHHGKLQDAFLRMVQVARAYDAYRPNGNERLRVYFQFDAIGIEVLRSPSVFNFFLPDFQPTGPILDAGLVAPEFELHNDVWAVSVKNAFKTISELGWTGFPQDTQLDFTALRDVWNNGGDEALIERIALLSARGIVSPDLQEQVRNAIAPISDLDDKIGLALYLIHTHADAAILR